MRASSFLLLVAVIGLGCGDDAPADEDRDGATEENADGGDGDGDADDGDGDGDGDGDPDGGDGDGDGDEDIVSAMIGPEGGTITSSDGNLTLTVPEGALRDGELISIELLPKGVAQSLLADANELVSYRFEPDGLQFDEPVELTVALPDLITPADDEVVVPLVFASAYSDADNTIEYLERQDLAIDLESGAGTFSSEIEHFSTHSFGVWPPDNMLKSTFFYFELSPLPPPEMELNKDYGIGLHFFTRRFLSEPLPLTYQDFSTSLVYSGGSGPVDIGSIPGEEDQPTEYVIDAGDYACSELGGTFYEARLRSELFTPPLVPSETCKDATEMHRCGVPNPPLPVMYNVRLFRIVECIPEEITSPDPNGAPFSGFVRHRRSLGGGSGRELSGAFYDGGADQDAFDAFVAAQRRQLGIMPDRGADGSCRAVDLALYNPYVANLGMLDFETSHVAAGADDLIAIDFLLGDAPFTAPFEAASGQYRSTFAYNMAFSDEGLAVHVPASAAEPTIVLPAWDENIGFPPDVAPGNLFAPFDGDDLTVTWQADEVGGGLVHIWGVGNDITSEGAAFECFASVEDQLVTIPAEIITGLFPATPTDPLSIDIVFEAGSHTTAERDGKTLDGYNIFRYSWSDMTEDPNNPEG